MAAGEWLRTFAVIKQGRHLVRDDATPLNPDRQHHKKLAWPITRA
jgi:hypothetical protein